MPRSSWRILLSEAMNASAFASLAASVAAEGAPRRIRGGIKRANGGAMGAEGSAGLSGSIFDTDHLGSDDDEDAAPAGGVRMRNTMNRKNTKQALDLGGLVDRQVEEHDGAGAHQTDIMQRASRLSRVCLV